MPKREKKFGINPFIIVFKKSVRSAKSRVSIPQKKGGVVLSYRYCEVTKSLWRESVYSRLMCGLLDVLYMIHKDVLKWTITF